MEPIFLNLFPLHSPSSPHLNVTQLRFGGEHFMVMIKMIMWPFLEVVSVDSKMVIAYG